MADEVIIRLRGSSQQLEASLTRISASFDRLQTQTATTNRAVQTGSQRSAKAIDNQNRSFTLMVAKLALVTFAAQTLANIFQNTFGAILKNIDDFNLAAIGTASAVTAITTETNRPTGDVFNQNLEATKQLFEELEIVAAKFFSSGQELQLAFNTLAQRGVVVRQEEFEILGKLTDQIKLLTGGQNTQIQIQQELRAILDGNVRTTTAFGKALQARGVDVAQLSREVRATGSLQPFAPFLTGLDAASGAIQRTLTSVLSTFGSLFNILSRNIFDETYQDVVSTITRVNNFIIDQRDNLIAVGRVLIEKVKFGFDQIARVVSTITNIVADIGTSGLGQLLVILKGISLLSSGPLKFLAIIGAIVFELTGDLEAASKAIDIFFKVFRIGLNIIEKGITGFFNLDKTIVALTNTFKGFQNIGLLSKEEDLEKTIAGLTPQELSSERGQALQRQLDSVRKQLTDNVTSMEADVARVSAEGGTDAGEGFIDSLGKSISSGIDALDAQVDSVTDKLGLTTAGEKIQAQFESLIAEAKALGKATRVDLAPTKQPVIVDSRIEEAELAKARSAFDNLIKIQDQARQASFDQELKRVDLLAAERSINGEAAFQREITLKQESIRLDLIALEAQRERIRERAKEDRAIINANLQADEGVTKIQEQEATLAIIQSIKKENEDIASIDQKINEASQKQARVELDAAKKITEENRKVNRIIQDRAQLLAETGGITNADVASRINFESERARSDFAAQNVADPQAIAEFNAQQSRVDFFKAVQPQIDAFSNAIDQTFSTLINGIVEGSFEFRDLAQTLSKDLIRSGLQDLIAQAKDAIVSGLETLFEGFSSIAAQRAAQALALGIGLLLAVLSRIGNEGEFTATGGSGGSSVTGSRQVQGIIGGETSIPIAEINIGLQEAMIPTNNLLSQIERNTRALAELNLNIDPSALQGAFSAQLNAFFQQMVLQNP